MTVARVILSLGMAGCAFIAACGSFDAAPDSSSADAGSANDAATIDGAPADAAAALDALQPSCTAQSVSDGFASDLAGWDTSRLGDLTTSTTIARSPPTSLFLNLQPDATGERFVARELPACHVKLSLWMYVEGGFGDGEVDFVTVTDSLTNGQPGVIVLGAKAYPGALSVEDFVNQRKTSAPSDTWVKVEMDVDPMGHHYSVDVGGYTFDGQVPDAFGASGHLYLLVGAPYVDAARGKRWSVYFDDLSLAIVPQ